MEKVSGLLPLGVNRVSGFSVFSGFWFRVSLLVCGVEVLDSSFFGFRVSLLVCGVEVLRGESIVIKFGKDL